MAHIVETTVYELHELSDAAKDKARDWFREGVGDWDWHDFIFEDFEEICRILGIELRTHSVRLMGGGTRQKSCIWFTGFSSQGDGACFEGSYRYESKSPRRIREHAPQDAELHRIADCLFEIQRDNFFQLHAGISHRGRYCHAYSMEISVERDSPFYQDMTAKAEDAVIEALRDLAHWLYRQLEREWDYMMSDEYADEGIAANGYTFTESGRRFG
ncbi:MAG: antitoxin of toxin-antitoxin stability system [Rhizobiales bacterium]|nr:antitoxin of toxin-antitoxin stability system [Hyphomicrobiales bacterium]